MLNIFIISNDKRVDALIEHCQKFIKTKIRRASDFDQGLKEVFENRPSLAFIQSTIGTVSGETVARHIKSLLGSGSPRIVFLGDASEKAKEGATWCDDWILLGDSEIRLREDFAALIEKYYPDDWREIAAETVPADASAGDTSSGTVSEAADDSLSAPSGDTGRATVQERHEPAACEVSAENEPVPDKQTVPPPIPSESSDQEEIPAYLNLYEGSFPGKEPFPGKKSRAGRYLLILFGFLFLAVAVWWVYFRPAGGGKPPVVTETKPPSVVSPGAVPSGVAPPRHEKYFRGLPSCIQQDWRDPSYQATNPGWERYLSPSLEFRIFREHGYLKALQIIARNGGIVPDALLKSALKELGFALPLAPGTVERKDGFRIEKTAMPGGAELIIYREEARNSIRAFVLVFS
jgi:flagellar FliL protein